MLVGTPCHAITGRGRVFGAKAIRFRSCAASADGQKCTRLCVYRRADKVVPFNYPRHCEERSGVAIRIIPGTAGGPEARPYKADGMFLLRRGRRPRRPVWYPLYPRSPQGRPAVARPPPTRKASSPGHLRESSLLLFIRGRSRSELPGDARSNCHSTHHEHRRQKCRQCRREPDDPPSHQSGSTSALPGTTSGRELSPLEGK